MDVELVAKEARRRRLRSMQGLAAITLGRRVLPALPRLEPHGGTAPAARRRLRTAVYLMSFFYVFAFWPIQSLVERLFDARQAAAGSALGQFPMRSIHFGSHRRPAHRVATALVDGVRAA